MEVIFHNVTITLVADTAEAAYARLCEVLGAAAVTGELEYTTDTYSTDVDDAERDTEDLMGDL